MFRVCGPDLKVRLRKTWERKQAVVPILSPLFTLFNAHVFVFLKPTPQSSIKVQPCFFLPSILSFSSPLILHHVALPSHHLSLRTHSFISLQHFRLDPSQRLLFIFAFSSSMIVCASLYVFVCVRAEYVHLRMWWCRPRLMVSYLRNG